MINRVPNNIREMIAIDLEMCGGRDWEHFTLGLGFGLKEKDNVRIKQGGHKLIPCNIIVTISR